MSLQFLPALTEGQGELKKFLTYFGEAFVEATSLDEAHAILERCRKSRSFICQLDISSLSLAADTLVSLLDAGAGKVFVSYEQLKLLEARDNVDLDRVVLKLLARERLEKSDIVDAISDTTVGLYFANVVDVEWAQDWLREYGYNRPTVYISIDGRDLAKSQTIKKFIELAAVPVISQMLLTDDCMKEPDLISLSSILSIKSDREDGLIPTIVTNEQGVALGLVYSSIESLQESVKTGRGVYQSRKRGLWYKGDTSGDIQELVRIQLDCDSDSLKLVVRQKGKGFCHLETATCFGPYNGLSKLQQTLQARKQSAPEGSYTARLFSSPELLRAKIMEEAEELCTATTKENISFEAADLIYFALTKCVGAGVTLEDIERNLDEKSIKVTRRKGDAKGQWAQKEGLTNDPSKYEAEDRIAKEAASVPKANGDSAGFQGSRIQMKRYNTATTSQKDLINILQRPSQKSTETIMGIVKPIIEKVRTGGDAALLEYTHKFERATSLKSPILRAPYPQSLMQLPPETIEAIDISYENIRKFHAGQKEDKPLQVETMPGVVCSRFSRPIERVGLYVPGGTAVLPSTALMLGVPAMVAGCKKIVLASPPRADGSITPEIVYIAHKVGAESIVLAGGAQAVAALAYGTESVSKVDKILGPGNQFVTAAKMLVSNDTSAGVSIDMPAGPSEVLVVADKNANPAFVASDLLSQAEHGVDSQVILIAVGLTESQLLAIEEELHKQACALPRVDIVRGAIEHSVTLSVPDIHEAMILSNQYAPEHLILQVENAEEVVDMVENAGSVFVGSWTPESVGDYSAGVNHSLPTYGYAKQYSGVNLASFVKHITSANLTAQGLRNVGGAVMQLAKVEELEAHRRAVSIRIEAMDDASSKK